MLTFVLYCFVAGVGGGQKRPADSECSVLDDAKRPCGCSKFEFSFVGDLCKTCKHASKQHKSAGDTTQHVEKKLREAGQGQAISLRLLLETSEIQLELHAT